MMLILIDSTRALHEANLFRARIVAATLAENGAELAAYNITSNSSGKVQDEDWQGTFSEEMTRSSAQFEINAEGTAIGVLTQRARLPMQDGWKGTW